MKKPFFCIIFLSLIINNSYSQNASSYFPVNQGYKWYYKNTPLDSNNIPQPSLATYRIDSFAVVSDYKGLIANIVRLKDNLTSFNQNTPYNDTNYYNFQTSNGWKYLSVSMLPDTISLPGIFSFLRSMENWYSTYRFAQAVNSEYVMVTKDTIVTINSQNLTLRAKLKGKRFNDEIVSTVNGNYTAKKFLLTFGLYLHAIIIDIPIVELPDTTWFAQNVWMVKDFQPSVKVDFTNLGYPISIPIPGKVYELALPPIGIKNISSTIPDKLELYQNYPNPFNPVTNIRFSVPRDENIRLDVYNILGAKVNSLFEGNLKAGEYSFQFDASFLSSGVYFYVLNAGDVIEKKKMILLK